MSFFFQYIWNNIVIFKLMLPNLLLYLFRNISVDSIDN